MSGLLLVMLGAILMAMGLVERGWFLLAVWLGSNFLVLGIAHARGLHTIFGKRSDGTLPAWSWVVFLPLLLYTMAIWHLIRLTSREPAHNSLANDLVVGRRLMSNELEGEFINYIDLTAEFAEPLVIRRATAYQCFPILDGSAPDAKALLTAVKRLRPGRTFIHCAQGHGRTGLFALAVMLQSGAARSVAEGLEKLKRARPGIKLSTVQRRCIQKLAADLGAQ